jgi:hypothetical protein
LSTDGAAALAIRGVGSGATLFHALAEGL